MFINFNLFGFKTQIEIKKVRYSVGITRVASDGVCSLGDMYERGHYFEAKTFLGAKRKAFDLGKYFAEEENRDQFIVIFEADYNEQPERLPIVFMGIVSSKVVQKHKFYMTQI